MTIAKPVGGQEGRAAKNVVSRFAPSPTGRLHLGHAWSALLAHDFARDRGGAFLLRIEDIDPGRSREEFVAGIVEDLAWLGITWDGAVVRQSQRLPLYAQALDKLKALGLVYPCFCTRAAIAKEIAASASAPHGPDGPLYPGTCRALSADERTTRMANEPHAWRLDIARATSSPSLSSPSLLGEGDRSKNGGGAISSSPRVRGEGGHSKSGGGASCYAGETPSTASRSPSPGTPGEDDEGPLFWLNHGTRIPAHPDLFGDVVLARKDAPTSYHLAVTVDDAAQGITDIVRGTDLYPSTHIHRLLQALLNLPTPHYHHHPLLTDPQGQRLAKRSGAPSLADLRAAGADPAQLADNLRKGILPAGIRMQSA